MPNGTPGDAPWSDFFVHNRKIFPADIADMLRRIRAYDVSLIRHLAHPDMWEWEVGRNLDDGRSKLKAIIEKHDIP